jgi:hypothetical protein
MKVAVAAPAPLKIDVRERLPEFPYAVIDELSPLIADQRRWRRWLRGTSFGPPEELLLDLNRDLIQPPSSPLCPFLMVPGLGLNAARRETSQLPMRCLCT